MAAPITNFFTKLPLIIWAVRLCIAPGRLDGHIAKDDMSSQASGTVVKAALRFGCEFAHRRRRKTTKPGIYSTIATVRGDFRAREGWRRSAVRPRRIYCCASSVSGVRTGSTLTPVNRPRDTATLAPCRNGALASFAHSAAAVRSITSLPRGTPAEAVRAGQLCVPPDGHGTDRRETRPAPERVDGLRSAPIGRA